MKKRGFTLAEVLITLTVIGIVAAISLPALIQGVNERTWSAKRKALHARMSAAISQIEDVTSYGKYEKDADNNITDTMAESFLIDGLSKVYKIKTMCDVSNLNKCGLPKTFSSMDGTSINLPKNLNESTGYSFSTNPKAAAFETENGEKIAIYYNPSCRAFINTETSRNISSSVCITFLYDLNGLEEPNQIGSDMGIMSVVYGDSQTPEVVAPNPRYPAVGSAPSYGEDNNAASLCKNLGNNYSLPSINDAMAVAFNSRLTSLSTGYTGTIVAPGTAGTAWYVNNNSTAAVTKRTNAGTVYCLKDN